MTIKKDEHTGQWYLYFNGDNGLTHFINDWEQLFGSWNWYSFHFLHLYFEKEVAWGESYEFSAAILGLGFTVRWTASISPEMQKRIDEVNNEWMEKLK